MTEKQLISQLKSLKDIQPSKDWVVFTKARIFGKEDNKNKKENSIVSFLSAVVRDLQIGERFIFNHKMAFASILTIVIFFGLFGFVQNSVPGDSLFVIKRFTEQSQAIFIADAYKPIHNLEMAGKRLDDLEKIAQKNDVKNLSSALAEYNETVSRAAHILTKAKNVEEIALEIRKLQEKEDKIRSYGIELNNNEDLDNALAEIVARELASLKEKELSEEKSEALKEAEKDFENNDYSAALEKILLIGK